MPMVQHCGSPELGGIARPGKLCDKFPHRRAEESMTALGVEIFSDNA
jgi:hypothetical protein